MSRTKTKRITRKTDIYQLYEMISYLNYVTYIFLGTLLFWLVNLPLLLGIWTLGVSTATLPILFLLAIPVGPGMIALLKALLHVKENEKIVQPFYEYYKANFKNTIVVWGISLLIMCLSLINFMFLNDSVNFEFFKWMNLFLFVLVAAFSINYLLVLANFDNLSVKQACILTATLSLVKSVRYALSLMILVGALFLFSALPNYFSMVDMGIISLLLLGNFYPIKEQIIEISKENKT